VSPRPQIDHVRRPQLLEAAAAVIAERGIASTRIADIAERAGTSPPAILYWFKSKDDLLAEALTVEEERFYRELTDRMEELESPRDKLRLMLESSAAEYDWTLWMELWTRALRDRSTLAARRRLDDRWRAQIAEVIREGQRAGEFGAADADEVALVLASLIDGLAVQVTLGDPAVSPEAMLARALDIAELLLQADLEPSSQRAVPAAAAGNGSGAAKHAVRETLPHLADTERRRELE
jgi:AcrR family transcriptional regulator